MELDLVQYLIFLKRDSETEAILETFACRRQRFFTFWKLKIKQWVDVLHYDTFKEKERITVDGTLYPIFNEII